jgi:hypothetical protein
LWRYALTKRKKIIILKYRKDLSLIYKQSFQRREKMSSLRTAMPYMVWRGPWILAIFRNDDEKKLFLGASIEIYFNNARRVVGTVKNLLSETFNAPARLMLDIVDCQPTPADHPTSVKVTINGQVEEMPVWHDNDLGHA